jgi:hypothetical protein
MAGSIPPSCLCAATVAALTDDGYPAVMELSEMDPDAQEAIRRLYLEPVPSDEEETTVWFDDEELLADGDDRGATDAGPADVPSR